MIGDCIFTLIHIWEYHIYTNNWIINIIRKERRIIFFFIINYFSIRIKLRIRAIIIRACSSGLSATSQQYFCLRTNQPPATSQQYFSLRTNQHQPSATSQANRLFVCYSTGFMTEVGIH
jgi:hypothetical protein